MGRSRMKLFMLFSILVVTSTAALVLLRAKESSSTQEKSVIATSNRRLAEMMAKANNEIAQKCEKNEEKQRSLEKKFAELMNENKKRKDRLEKAEKYIQTIKEKIQVTDNGIVVQGSITHAMKAQTDGRKTNFFLKRAVFSFIGEPNIPIMKGDEHNPYYYHIKTPLRKEDGRMYRYDLDCYAYGEARAFSAVYVGYLFSAWNKQAGAPIVHPYSKDSGSKSSRSNFKTSQYIGKDNHLYLKFGPINRYVLQCVLHAQDLPNGKDEKYSVFTRKGSSNDTPYPEQ